MEIITKITPLRHILYLIMLSMGLAQSAFAQDLVKVPYPLVHFQLSQSLKIPELPEIPELKYISFFSDPTHAISLPGHSTSKIYLESFQFKPSFLRWDNVPLAHYAHLSYLQKTNQTTDPLQSNLIYRVPNSYSIPTYNFQPNTTNSIWEDLGYILVGISRAAIFPDAPDYIDL